MRYLSHTEADIECMLQTIGKPTIESLFNSVPSSLRLKRPLDLPKGLSEIELKRDMIHRAGQAPRLSFLGAGAPCHHVPELVSQMLLRGEWLTAYTPYQPEVSQGTMQAIFEFQTIVAGLYGCELANASMYDGACALAEALLMALRLQKNAHVILMAKSVHPLYEQVCRTWLKSAEVQIDEIPLLSNGIVDEGWLENRLKKQNQLGEVAAVVYQTPNFLGQLENQKHLIALAHEHKALAIAANAEPVAFGLIASPGFCGADIVIGEGLGLCGHLSLGAPGVGLFATKQQFVRQLPGRLVGMSQDSKENRGFVLAFSAREQHIRREKATSNICTNHNLMALAFTIALSLYGKTGFKELACCNLQKTLYFRDKAKAAGLTIPFSGPHFNETVIRFSSRSHMLDKMQELACEDVFAGVDLGRWFPEYEDCLLVATTELHRDDEIDKLVMGLKSDKH